MRRLSSTMLGAAGLALGACTITVDLTPGGGGGAPTSAVVSSAASTGTGLGPFNVSQVDLLLAVDNRRSAGDVQQILSLTIAELIEGLVNPLCVKANGAVVLDQPSSLYSACPVGSVRSFAAVPDIHIGVVSSSLGSFGADACPDIQPGGCPGGAGDSTTNDHGRLVTRSSPCGGSVVHTYQGEGFLAWDQELKDTPAGDDDVADLTQSFAAIVGGVGNLGCGYSAPLESWYRFLVDSEPPESFTLSGQTTRPKGLDTVLLAQRADFLRPGSLLAIVMLDNHDDCSIVESGSDYLVGQLTSNGAAFHLPPARSECATNPADPCCLSCGESQGSCPPDPTCETPLDDTTDNPALRCWDQKRRFGIDFLYPTDRYVAGLTTPMVVDRSGQLVANPIFSNLSATLGAPVRDPGLVFLAGIVGVPWQDVATDIYDLSQGYKTSAGLSASIGGVTTWDAILGDPATYQAPLDPHMIASDLPRSGTDPVDGVTLAPVGSPDGADAINGREYTTNAADLEYACIFPLPAPRDCTDPSQATCDCTDPANDSPLCEPDPTKNNGRTLQVQSGVYPALRQLSVLRGVGAQGVVTSACPAQITEPTQASYAYRQAIRALLQRIGTRLVMP
jgi:hypothetical protein